MRPAVGKLYGRLSARTKLEALTVVILLALSVAAYHRGKTNGRVNAKVVQVDRARRQNADTIKAKTKAAEKVHAASDSAHVISTAANTKAAGFKIRPIPIRPAILQTPANDTLVATLYAVIANRDTAITLLRDANTKLVHENSKLLTERDTTASLVRSLNRQISLDVAEISLLKKVKTPRFGIKTGILIGAVTAIAVDTGIKRLKN